MAKRRPSGDGMVRKREDGRWEGRIVGIGDEQILVVLGFHVAVHRECADEIAVAPLHVQ